MNADMIDVRTLVLEEKEYFPTNLGYGGALHPWPEMVMLSIKIYISCVK